ncbi:MAG: hypothetical protein HZB84_09950 [Deltaproteobacteria bacterium]|nr:hypothetical protein [Deltaproteobacteria bacterium]
MKGVIARRSTIAFTLLALSVFFLLTSCKGSKTEVKNAAGLRGGETRQTLSPIEFTGATAHAYEIAREIPEVLDSLHCYCECKKNFGHKSLLTCYVDEHARHCDVCQDEAFMAYELHRQGMDIISIRKAVDARFASLSH